MKKTLPPEEKKNVQLYVKYDVDADGEERVIGYAYGEPWVSQALFMDDLCFDTEQEAKDWWEKYHG